jgi:amidase
MATTVTIASGATWQEVAVDRQAYRDAGISMLDPPLPAIPSIPVNTIPLARQILTEAEIKITETAVEELVPMLANRTLKATDVAKAFLRRAGLAQKAVGLPLPRAIPAGRGKKIRRQTA